MLIIMNQYLSKITQILLILSVGIIISFKMNAQSRIYVNEYLNIGVGARGLAMGGAQTASINDVHSGFWNPAGLMNIEDGLQVGLMHAEYFAGIFKYDYGAVALPMKNKKRTLGLSFVRFATDNIPYTLDYVQPDGSLDESKLKGFSAGDYALMLSYAQPIKLLKDSNLVTNIGASAKVLYRNVGSMANAWGFGLDIGLQGRYKERLVFGLMMKDITTTYTSWTFNLTEAEKDIFRNTNNEIPIKSYEIMLPRFNLGIGYHLLKPKRKIQVLAEAGFDITTDGRRATLIASNTLSVDPRLGIEASYKQTIFLRAGVNNIYRAMDNSDTTNKKKYTMFQPSVGVGFLVKSISVDYAFTSLQMQDNPLMSHIVSLRVNFNKPKKKVDAETEEILNTIQPITN